MPRTGPIGRLFPSRGGFRQDGVRNAGERALAGSGFMLYHICVNQAAALVGTSEQRTRNFSVLALAFSTSGFVGPMMAGFAIDSIGHRNTFLLCAFFAVAALALIRHRKHALSRLHGQLFPKRWDTEDMRRLLEHPACVALAAVSSRSCSSVASVFTSFMKAARSSLVT